MCVWVIPWARQAGEARRPAPALASAIVGQGLHALPEDVGGTTPPCSFSLREAEGEGRDGGLVAVQTGDMGYT